MLQTIKLDRGWNFQRLGDLPEKSGWTSVDLPHSAVLVDLDGCGHWQGQCQYRRTLCVEQPLPGARYAIYVGAAMHTATVLIDGVALARHTGGYLPFEVDLTGQLRDGREHELTLSLDNRDNPDVPPGKPLAELDFCWYGGLYREVELRVYPPVHITDAVSAGEVAGGGVFVRTLRASDDEAVVVVRTHIRNASSVVQSIVVSVDLLDGNTVVASGQTRIAGLAADASAHVESELTLVRPRLWSPASPVLHHARVTVCGGSCEILDKRTARFGVRRIAFSRAQGFQVNGRSVRLRGTNRHQDYPYLGYALPRAAQYRDARRIKEAGFDYVRLCHYPQSPDFLDACDEFGLVVMNCIPGWQFIGGDTFRAACYESARQLVRRDRNHPCVVLWELSLNETPMDEAFMTTLHAIGHEEYPGDQMYTCGWIDRYDVFTHSRQHGEMHRWENADKALVIAEYGDWEYYASNHGFDQKTGAGVHAAWSNSRQFRAQGERGLRQQAWNHVVALNDTLSSPAAFDGQWSMFDYARGYHPVRAATGVMDIVRLPKFSYHFYRSQRDPNENAVGWFGGPMVFIASHWTAASNLRVLVFSNCDEVELSLNGLVIGRQTPSKAATTQYLPHPPFVFDLPYFEPGVLDAAGFIGGQACACHRIGTPGAAAQIELLIDDAGIQAAPDEPDLIFAHACWRDEYGHLCIGESGQVSFAVEGDAVLVGPTSIRAEAGIASALLRLTAGARTFQLTATPRQPQALTVRYDWPKKNNEGHRESVCVNSVPKPAAGSAKCDNVARISGALSGS
jgi:beta-galactosidase